MEQRPCTSPVMIMEQVVVSGSQVRRGKSSFWPNGPTVKLGCSKMRGTRWIPVES